MKITFRYNIRDRLAFAAYHLPRSPMVLLFNIGLILFVLFDSILPGIPNDKPAVFRVCFAIFAVAMLTLLLIAVWTVIMLAGTFSSKDKALMSERTVTFGEDGFVSETSFSHSEYKWQIVQKLGRTRRQVFLYVSKDSAAIIPRRAFENEPQWSEFYEYCRRKTRR